MIASIRSPRRGSSDSVPIRLSTTPSRRTWTGSTFSPKAACAERTTPSWSARGWSSLVTTTEPGPHLADEVGVAGGVDEIDLRALEHDRGDGKGDGPILTEGHLRECLDQGGLT